MSYTRWSIAALLVTASVSAVAAQDVEMLGRRYGTRPPAAYFEARRRDPSAFEFRRGGLLRRIDALSVDVGLTGAGGADLTIGPRTGTVEGTFSIPVLLGLYSNSLPTPPFQQAEIQAGYFGSTSGTITDYYAEVSGGKITLVGDVSDWARVARPDTVYAAGVSGLLLNAPLGGGGAGNFVYDLLVLNAALDWGRYDNDGPDGLPNSGDDDGIVDVVSVVHPTSGAECDQSTDRIWSHFWRLSEAVGTAFVTSTLKFGGTGFIRVDDYTIQPSIACTGVNLNPIGVFTHELGHAFGLPDLYDTNPNNGQHSGAGIWDLMASGSWGCNNISPSTPCHMGAWSKAMLGWVDIVTLAPDLDHGTLTLPPVETGSTVYRVDANDGSGEYFLLENRQRIGNDVNLYSEGLLVWQIDPDWISARWGLNEVNANDHMGVWLRQADGRDDLGSSGGGRGDAGDPYPGLSGSDAFHAATNPGAISFGGGVTGVSVFDIALVADDVEFRLTTRFSTLTVRADGASGTSGLFTVDGQSVDPPATTFVSAPFVQHTIEAVAGEPIQPGERTPFLEWLDDNVAPRNRVVATPLADTVYVARYGGTQFELAITQNGGVNGVVPSTFVSQPASEDLWFAPGVLATVEAIPQTGFVFLDWGGALAGQPNPASVTMTTPLTASADFSVVYAIASSTVQLPAATPLNVQLEVENGTPPHSWRVVAGALPQGLIVNGAGRILGAALEVGVFDVTLEAVDGVGLPATGTVSLNLVDPVIAIERLASPFLLSGPPLATAQQTFLNLQGNGVGSYDIGDFRAWVLAHPSLPLSANFKALVAPATVVIPMKPEPPGAVRP